MFKLTILTLFVGAVLCAPQPEKLPVLKEAPAEVLFRVSDKSELVLECATENKENGVKYSWLKDGKPFAPTSDVVQKDNEGTLVFKKPTKTDQGQYQCLAKTNLGTASSRIINAKHTFIEAPTVSLKKHKPVEGEVFKLDCAIPNSYPKPEIKWLYQSLSDPSISRTILNYRIMLSPLGDLFFTNITKEDSSPDHKYVCVAKSPARDDEVVLAEHVIEDIVPGGPENAELVKLYTSGDMTAKVGDVTMIYCIYGGTPLAYPDWHKDGKNVNNQPADRVTRYNRSGGKRLLIKDTWLSDDGEYTCIVDNEVGKVQKNTIKLTVVSAPQLIKKGPSKLMVKSGEDFTIPCEVAGVPPPSLTWTFNAHSLQQGAPEPVSRGNVTAADLTLKHAQGSAAGYYGCRATNPHGEVYSETLVYVQ